MTRLKYLAHIEMGQSPSSEDCHLDPSSGLPFFQGTAEFGSFFPVARQYCAAPPKLAAKGDLLFSVRAPVGEINIAPSVCGIGRGLCAISPQSDVDRNYLWWALHWVRGQLDIEATGSTYEAVAAEDVGNLRLTLPALVEQRAIAFFLDEKVKAIDELVEEKRSLRRLLIEKRRAMVTHAVTRGLHFDFPRRDSGIPWLGEIPAHWEVRSLRRLVTSLEQGWSPVASNQPAGADEYGVLKLSAIKGGHFWAEENKALSVDDDVPEHLTIRKDDVFITRANTPGLVGDIAVAHENHPRLIFSDLIYRLRCDHKVALPAWLAQVLLSGVGRGQIEAEAKGSSVSMVKLAQDQVLGLLLPTPPELEQHAIAEYIQAETKKLNDLAEAAERTIALLQERRSALIYAAVSGAKDWGKSDAH